MDAKSTYATLQDSFAPELKGQTASLQEAAQQFSLSKGTIAGWIKNNLVQVIEPPKRRGMPMKINLRDVAIMVELNRLHRAESNSRGPLRNWNNSHSS